jgi:DNA modification methylase
MTAQLYQGDCIETMRGLPDGCVQTCVTSPPYYGLRDYGTATWEGGSAECDHRKNPEAYSDKAMAKSTIGAHSNTGHAQEGYKNVCGKCGAKRIDNQIGLEDTPDAYVAKLVDVFREVRRLLRDDGTLWLNLGDSYAAGWMRQSSLIYMQRASSPKTLSESPG